MGDLGELWYGLDANQVVNFFSFIRERENIRLRRLRRQPYPWTEDPILCSYRFTNVKRKHDKTTQWAIKNWYEPNKENENLGAQFFNCAVFRYFGTIEFAKRYGWSESFYPQKAIKVVEQLRAEGKPAFTSAYVITNSGIKAPKEEVVANNFLMPLFVKREEVVEIAQDTKSWKAVFEYLKEFEGFGGTGFMAKEVLQDTMFTAVLQDCIDADTWSPCGPGATRGIEILLGEHDFNADAKKRIKGLTESKKLSIMKYLRMLSLHGFWPKRWEPLTVHDIQFSLCEFAKYMRIKNGCRAKRKYHPT